MKKAFLLIVFMYFSAKAVWSCDIHNQVKERANSFTLEVTETEFSLS
jgi:hypothetical protein